MFSSGAAMVVLFGRGSGLLLFGAGGAHIVRPFPPAILDVMDALFLFLAALVFVCVADFLAFYLGVLKGVPRTAKGLADAKKIRLETFASVGEAAHRLKEIYSVLIGRGSLRGKSE
jgi:hypothetical protein